jgi:octaprenyl-diphosphate synthase
VTTDRKARRLDITEDIYYEIIRKKQQHLLLLAVHGAKSVIEDEVQVENMRKFGSSSVWHSKLR